jgi:hypothetical protein
MPTKRNGFHRPTTYLSDDLFHTKARMQSRLFFFFSNLFLDFSRLTIHFCFFDLHDRMYFLHSCQIPVSTKYYL